MPKRKKTRKQKTLADVRRQTEQTVRTHTPAIETKQQIRKVQTTAPLSSLPSPQKPKAANRVYTAEYKYLSGDVRKTLILTITIIGLELVLKFGTGI